MSRPPRRIRSLPLLGFALPLVLLLSFSSSLARQWHVYPDGSGDAATIAAAIDSSSAPDTVAVHAGTYFEADLAPRIGTVLLGVDPVDDVIIDGSSATAAVIGKIVVSTVSPSPKVEGLTIINGVVGMWYRGVGPADVVNCVIRDCDTGVKALGASVVLRDTRILDGATGIEGLPFVGVPQEVSVVDCELRGQTVDGARFDLGFEVTGTLFAEQVRGLLAREGAGGSIDGCTFEQYATAVASDGGSIAIANSSFPGGVVGIRGYYVLDGDHRISVVDCGIRNHTWRAAYLQCDYDFRGTVFEGNEEALFAEGFAGSLVRCDLVGNGSGIHAYGGSTELDSCRIGNGILPGTTGKWGFESTDTNVFVARNTTFERNGGPASPVGAGIVEHSGAFVDCDFLFNESARGGALQLQGDTTLERCRFIGNGTPGAGGALAITGASVTATSCLFTGDTADTAGAVWMAGNGHLELRQCLVAFEGSADPIVIGATGGFVDPQCTDFYASGPAPPGSRLAQWLASGQVFSADPLFCGDGDFSIGDLSRCAPAASPCGLLVGRDPVGCMVSGVHLETEPAGLLVSGDGDARPSSAFFPWESGEVHQVSAPDSQAADYGALYVFAEWDDGGDRTHDVTVGGPGTLATARFDERYRLLMESEGAGSVSPATSYWLPGATVEIVATPDSGWVFERWWGDGLGSYVGEDSVATVSVGTPLLEHAVFAPGVPVTIRSIPEGRTVLVDGEPRTTPTTFLFHQDWPMTVDANAPQDIGPGARYRFVSWSDLGAEQHVYPVGTDPVELTVEYAVEYELTFGPEEHATITPGDGWHAPGTIVPIEATADYEWAFAAWVGAGEGSYSGLDNPAQVTMDGPVQQDAVIVEAFGGHGYEFTISASNTDPNATSAPPAAGARELHLWGTCLQRGLTAFEAEATGTLPVADFIAAPGVLNAGSPTHLFLAVGGCPTGDNADVLLGHWVVVDLAGGALCLTAPDGVPIATTDCTPDAPVLWPDPGVTGFASDGSTPCAVGSNGCLEDPVPVELSGLRAEAIDGTVIVSWQTALELNHDGFHVYRASLGEADPVRRTETLLRGRSPYAWVDRAAEANHTYRYWVGAIDRAGREQRFGPVEVTTPRPLPSVTTFAGPRPTPFRGRTKLAFALAADARVELTIFDVAGRVVRRYADLYRAGEHAIEWDARGTDGGPVPGGVYFASFRAGDVRETRKLVLLPGR